MEPEQAANRSPKRYALCNERRRVTVCRTQDRKAAVHVAPILVDQPRRNRDEQRPGAIRHVRGPASAILQKNILPHPVTAGLFSARRQVLIGAWRRRGAIGAYRLSIAQPSTTAPWRSPRSWRLDNPAICSGAAMLAIALDGPSPRPPSTDAAGVAE
jgi:hypothetical protein